LNSGPASGSVSASKWEAKLAIDVDTVLEAFQPSLFIPKLKAKKKDSVLQELVDKVCASGIVRDADPLLEMLRSREKLGSTGIGRGVAVPHGRSLAVQRVVAVFGHHSKGIEWQAVDGEPVRLVFLILAPPLEQSSRYLPFLGRIVEAVSDDKRREQLAGITTYEEFQEIIRDALA
jgi:mannitol/fructose-specific phosphotransferase system IIA component (Ntr-type)